MFRLAAAVASVLLWTGPAVAQTSGSTIAVAAGGDLQGALNRARPGDTITLEPGATYVGNFVLPSRPGGSDAFITLRSAAPDTRLPGAGIRITPAAAPQLPKLRSPNSLPALSTAPGAHHYRLLFLEFLANAQGAGDIIALGDGSPAQNTLSLVPHDLIVDRCYIHGDAAQGQKRGISLNSATTSLVNSHISDIKLAGQDTQALAGWNGPGPFTITNNYLEAAGENIIFGGSDPAIPNLVPSDISIAGNHITRPTAWRAERWTVKNLLELKNARRVTIARNLLEHNWQGGQSGFAVLFTPRNQDGRCPWCQVEEVVFEENVVRHSAAGIVILGYDDQHPSRQTRNIAIRHNVFSDIDSSRWGGNGYFLMLLGGARDVVVDHNTIIQPKAHGILTVDGPPVLGFVFTNNLVRHNDYGIIGANRGPGDDTIRAYFPGSRIVNNVIAEGDPRRYPEGNLFPSTAEFVRQFASYEGGDYRLASGSRWRGAGTDGLDLGASQGSSREREAPSPRLPDAGLPEPRPF